MKPAIGMSVPGASDLGMGLTPQDETEDERRKRLLKAQQEKLLPSLSSSVASLGLGPAGYGAAIDGL